MLSYRHRGLTADDCFVASFPRSGNTWVRFLLADIASGQRVDYELIDGFIPAVGAHSRAPLLLGESRLIKTHEPYRREYRRAVYLVRDVRDVVLSWYRVTRPDRDNFADLDRLVERFVAGKATPYGKWTDHVLSWLRRPPGTAEVLVVSYAELQADTLNSIQHVVDFVGLTPSESQLRETLARYPIDEMRRLQYVNAMYLREAYDYRTADTSRMAGGWRHKLTDRHLELLGPALRLQEELGFDRMHTSILT